MTCLCLRKPYLLAPLIGRLNRIRPHTLNRHHFRWERHTIKMNRHLIQDSPSMNYILPAAYSLNIHVGDLLLSEIITFSSLLA